MNNRVVFHCSVIANYYLAKVATYHRAGPNTRVFTDLDITYNIGSFTYKSRPSYLGLLAIKTPNHSDLLNNFQIWDRSLQQIIYLEWQGKHCLYYLNHRFYYIPNCNLQ